MNTPDIVYYNIQVNCVKQNQTDQDISASFREVRETSILDKPETYNFSIVRFTLSTSNFPVLIPKISSGNTCTYGMIMSYHSGAEVSSPTYVNYTCTNRYVNTPSDERYYFIYNVQSFVNMMNEAFVTCTNDINTKASISCNPPFMTYDSSAHVFSIYFDANFFTQSDNMAIYFNDDLYNLFRSFDYTFVSFAGFNYLLNTGNRLTNSVTYNSVNYFVATQSNCSMQNWSPVSSIVFTSNIGVLSELVSNPYILSFTPISSVQSNLTQNIVSDIVMVADYPEIYNSYVVLSPNFPREENMNMYELRNIDMAVSWKDKTGNLHTLYLSDGDIFTVKIKFEKK